MNKRDTKRKYWQRIRDFVTEMYREAFSRRDIAEERAEARSQKHSGSKQRHLRRHARQSRSMRSKDRLGRDGERLAVEYLQSRGLCILETNRLMGSGELDIVARDGGCLVFVEVKTRRSDNNGGAVAAVSESKRRSLHRSAQVYISSNALDDLPVRFDVIAVTWPEGEEPRIEHLRDAFEIPADW